MSSFVEEYLREQGRLSELIAQYKEIGSAGVFGLATISEVLRRANVAAVAQDTVEMIRCYKEMQGCQ